MKNDFSPKCQGKTLSKTAARDTLVNYQRVTKPSVKGNSENIKNLKRDGSQSRIQRWNNFEQKKYINFLAQNKRLFDLCLSDKKAKGVHTRMSRYIKSRSAIQCRSHHQKMLINHGSFENVLISNKDLIYESSLKKLSSGGLLSLEVEEKIMKVEFKTQEVLPDLQKVEMMEELVINDLMMKDQKEQECQAIQFFDFNIEKFDDDSLFLYLN